MMEDGKYYFMSRDDKIKKLEGVYEKLEDICIEVNLFLIGALSELICFFIPLISFKPLKQM